MRDDRMHRHWAVETWPDDPRLDRRPVVRSRKNRETVLVRRPQRSLPADMLAKQPC
jgi:hypothetical protein